MTVPAPGSVALPHVLVYGAGRAGRSLARACLAASVPIVGVHGRSALPDDPDHVSVGTLPSGADQADVVLVTVRDAQLDDAFAMLAAAPLRPGTVVLHASGSAEPVAIALLRTRGFPSGTFHPLVPLADPERGATAMRGAYVGVDGDAEAVAAARTLAAALGARAVRIPVGRKPLYHASAVFASNFVTVLAALAARLFRESGLSPADAEGATRALVRTATANVERGSFARALTGPASRGEIETIERHLEALTDYPLERDVYDALTAAIVDVLDDEGHSLARSEEMRATLEHSIPVPHDETG